MDIGTIIIIVALLIMPVMILMTGAAGAAALGALINSESDSQHEGTELHDVWG